MDFTKIVKTDLDPPRQELFNDGLGFIIALPVLWRLFFCVLVLEKQSSCNRALAWYATRFMCGQNNICASICMAQHMAVYVSVLNSQ